MSDDKNAENGNPLILQVVKMGIKNMEREYLGAIVKCILYRT